MAHDVFISYSSRDKIIADAVCAALESRKIRCWMAPRDVLPGIPYAEAIVNGIILSHIFVLVFSSDSNSSTQVMREVEIAVQKGIPIIPLRIENVIPSGAMQYYLAVPHWLDALTPPLERHLQKLADTVSILLSAQLEKVPEKVPDTTPESIKSRLKMSHIFIAHVEEDADIALGTALGLEQAGYRTWTYEIDSIPGISYISQIGEAVVKSDIVVVIISPDSLSSHQVTQEVVHAYESGRNLMPILRGISHAEFQQRQPEWREAVGSTTSIRVPREGVVALTTRLVDGLKSLGIQPNTKADADRIARLRNALENIPAYPKETFIRSAAAEAPGKIGGARAVEPVIKASPVSEVPGGRVDLVHFTVTSPPAVQPDDSFMVSIWAHLEKQRQKVIKIAREAVAHGDLSIISQGPVKIEQGTVLTVRLDMDDFVIKPVEATILWEGEIGNATFGVTVPGDAKRGRRVGTATIHNQGFQIAIIFFELNVAKKTTTMKQLKAKVKQHRTAFASYASSDRREVLKRIQGMQKADPKLDIFLDVDSLRSGQEWWKEIQRIIPSRDVFYLFWSASASKSSWVEQEWRYALNKRGLHFIDPCPLVSPKKVPPPKELEKLHFDDRWRAYGENGESN